MRAAFHTAAIVLALSMQAVSHGRADGAVHSGSKKTRFCRSRSGCVMTWRRRHWVFPVGSLSSVAGMARFSFGGSPIAGRSSCSSRRFCRGRRAGAGPDGEQKIVSSHDGESLALWSVLGDRLERQNLVEYPKVWASRRAQR